MSDVTETLRAAVLAIQHADDEKQRRKAQDFCENVKQNADVGTLIDASFFLSGKNEADEVRHFACHLLEHILVNRWMALQPNEKEWLKNKCIQLLQSGTRDMMEERLFIKEKIASLIVILMKLQWPQHWPSALDVLFSFAGEGDSALELVLLILRSIPEQVVSQSCDMVEERRKEFAAAIVAVADDILSRVASAVVQYSQHSSDRNIHILNVLLQCLIPYAELVPSKTFFSLDIIPRVFPMLRNEVLRMSAVEFLLALVSRNWKHENSDNVKMMLSLFINFCVSELNTSQLLEDYDFHKKLCEILVELCLNNLHHVKKTESDVYESICNVTLGFSNHPSIAIYLQMVLLWSYFVKDDNIATAHFFSKFYGSLLEMSFLKIKREYSNPEGNLKNESTPFAEIEFCDAQEYQQFFAVFKSRVLALIKHITVRIPDVAFRFIVERSCSMFNINAVVPQNEISENGYCSMRSGTYVEWEVCSSVFEVVVEGIPPQHRCGSESGMSSNLRTLVQMFVPVLLSLDISDPVIVARYLHFLGRVSGLAKLEPNLIGRVIDRICAFIGYVPPQENDTGVLKLCDDTLASRRKACSSLVRFARDVPEHVYNCIEEIARRMQDLRLRNRVTLEELTLIHEALVLSSNWVTDTSTQYRIVGQILAPYVDEWVCPEITKVVSNGVELCRCIFAEGVSQEHTISADSARKVHNAIIGHLKVFTSITRRVHKSQDDKTTESASLVHLDMIIPNVFKLLVSIHEIWNPSSDANRFLHSVFPSVGVEKLLDMCDEERRAALGTSGVSKIRIEDVESKKPSWAKEWLLVVRERSYLFIGYCSRLNSSHFYTENALNSLRLVIRSEPVVKYCPTERHDEFLLPLLQEVFSLFLPRIAKGWTLLASEQESAATAPETVQVLVERVLRTLTNEFFDFLLLLSQLHVKKSDAEAMEKLESSIGLLLQKILSNEYSSLLLQFLVHSLTFPNSYSIRKSVVVLQRVVEFLGKSLQIDSSEFLKLLLRTCLCYLGNADESTQNNIYSLIRDIYMIFRPISTFVRDSFSTLPGMNEEKLSAFEQRICSTRSTKEQKSQFKKLLAPIIGKGPDFFHQRRKAINAIPERLVIFKPSDRDDNGDDAVDGIHFLFG